jgi:hypothetical protein
MGDEKCIKMSQKLKRRDPSEGLGVDRRII